MNVKVKYFGMIAEKIDLSEEEINFDTSQFPIELKVYFEEKYSFLSSMDYNIAVNQKITERLDVMDNSLVEIALLPPFAGG